MALVMGCTTLITVRRLPAGQRTRVTKSRARCEWLDSSSAIKIFMGLPPIHVLHPQDRPDDPARSTGPMESREWSFGIVNVFRLVPGQRGLVLLRTALGASLEKTHGSASEEAAARRQAERADHARDGPDRGCRQPGHRSWRGGG